MCEAKFLEICSFSIILTSLHSFNLSFQLPFYVIFAAIPNFPPSFLHRHADSQHFSHFQPDSPHIHADSPHSQPIPRISLISFPNSPQISVYIIYEVISGITKNYYFITYLKLSTFSVISANLQKFA